MYTKRSAFTMIELIWVIVILGILAAVAVPKLAATRDDAHIAQGRADVLTIRSGIINERQARMFRGQTNYTASLGGSNPLFDQVVQTGIRPSGGSGGWTKTSETPTVSYYKFHLNDTAVTFEYNVSTGTFACDPTTGTAAEKKLCSNLTR